MTLTDYMHYKRGGRGIASIEDRVDTSIQRLEDYEGKHEGGLVTAIRNNTDNTMDNRMTIITKQNGKKSNSMGVSND